jgi:protein O-GlcNAc transferase
MAESSFDQLLETAKDHHKARRFAEAEPLYRRYLAMKPDSHEAAHLLGYMVFEAGRPEPALELIGRAIAMAPEKAEYHCNLGVVLSRIMRQEEAIESLKKALSLKRDFPEAWYNLAGAYVFRGKAPEAIDAYQQAISQRPTYADAFNNLANVFVSEGRFEEAIAAYQQALVLRPNLEIAAYNLGIALRKVGRFDEAIFWLRQAVALQPEYRDACLNLAIYLRERAQWTEAVAMYRRAVFLFNGAIELQLGLAASLVGAGEFDEAISLYNKSLASRPGAVTIYRGLGLAHEARGNLAQADEAFNQALKIQPEYVEGLCDLGRLKIVIGRVDQAVDCFNQAINLRPTDPIAYSNRLAALHFLPDFDPVAIYHEHIDWNQKHAQPLNYEIRPHDNGRDPDRRLRVGYVSPDFHEHPVSFFMESVLAGHDPQQVEVYAYADSTRYDAVTARLQKLVPQWRNITAFGDQNVAEMIRKDQIDILIDLAGHTSGNRLLLFARKPAPIQMTYLGYPGTTGLSAMDYRLTDVHADPPEMTEQYYSEKLIRLPRSFLCYRPPSDAPEVGPLPALSNGFITFGSFNHLAKINPQVVELWSQILKQIPNSRMLIKNAGLADESARRELLARFAANGVESSRVELRGAAATHADHLRMYNEMDITLDTFPYNGTTTSCEAMWMGVPMVTLEGQRYAGRVGLSLMTNIKLPELIAKSPAEYLELAVDLAGDTSALSEIRGTMREWMLESPLMNGRRLAWNLEFHFRAVWKEWAAATAVPVGT